MQKIYWGCYEEQTCVMFIEYYNLDERSQQYKAQTHPQLPGWYRLIWLRREREMEVGAAPNTTW
jgi:hypothetical protein